MLLSRRSVDDLLRGVELRLRFADAVAVDEQLDQGAPRPDLAPDVVGRRDDLAECALGAVRFAGEPQVLCAGILEQEAIDRDGARARRAALCNLGEKACEVFRCRPPLAVE